MFKGTLPLVGVAVNCVLALFTVPTFMVLLLVHPLPLVILRMYVPVSNAG